MLLCGLVAAHGDVKSSCRSKQKCWQILSFQIQTHFNWIDKYLIAGTVEAGVSSSSPAPSTASAAAVSSSTSSFATSSSAIFSSLIRKMLKEERCVKSERMKQFLVKRPNHAQSYCLQWDSCDSFCHYWSSCKWSCDGSSDEKCLLKASVTVDSSNYWSSQAWWEKAVRAQSLNLTIAERCLPISTITNNLLPFHFCLLPLLSSSSSGSWYYVLNSLQVGKIWPEVVKFVCGLYWLYFMIIYLSYNNACLRERKLTGRKCLKQKWLKKEEFLRRVGGSGFAENRARISF